MGAMSWLAVFVFGGLGAVARVGLASLLPVRDLPWATLAANLLGCLAIGVAFQVFEQRVPHLAGPWRLALVGGFLGGFTTFSAFGMETFLLLDQGRPGIALLYAGGSLVLGLAAVALGVVGTRALL